MNKTELEYRKLYLNRWPHMSEGEACEMAERLYRNANVFHNADALNYVYFLREVSFT